jgi:hypothetical protein
VIEALQALHFLNDEYRVPVKLTRDVAAFRRYLIARLFQM